MLGMGNSYPSQTQERPSIKRWFCDVVYEAKVPAGHFLRGWEMVYWDRLAQRLKNNLWARKKVKEG